MVSSFSFALLGTFTLLQTLKQLYVIGHNVPKNKYKEINEKPIDPQACGLSRLAHKQLLRMRIVQEHENEQGLTG